MRTAFAAVGRFAAAWLDDIWPGPATYRALIAEHDRYRAAKLALACALLTPDSAYLPPEG